MHNLRCHQKTCVTFSVCGVDLVLKGRRLSRNYESKYDFMKRTLIQCLHRTCSSTHTRKNHKKRPFSSWTKSCPATFEGIYTSALLIFLIFDIFKTAGVFSYKMSLPSRVISVTKSYESLLRFRVTVTLCCGLAKFTFNLSRMHVFHHSYLC